MMMMVVMVTIIGGREVEMQQEEGCWEALLQGARGTHPAPGAALGKPRLLAMPLGCRFVARGSASFF